MRVLNTMMNVVCVRNGVAVTLVMISLLEVMLTVPGCIQTLLCSLEFHLCHPCSSREMGQQMFVSR